MWFLIGKWTILGAWRSRGSLGPSWLAEFAKNVGTKRSYLQKSQTIQPKTSEILPTICQKIGNYPAALPRQAGAFLQEDWGALATHLLLDRAACTPAFFRCVLAGGWVVGRSFVEELAASAWLD